MVWAWGKNPGVVVYNIAGLRYTARVGGVNIFQVLINQIWAVQIM